jgi:hypothetical protein
MEMQDIEFFLSFRLVELLYHLVAHVVAVLNCIVAMRLAVMVTDIIDCLVGHCSAGEVVHDMVLCQSLCEIGCSTGKPADPLGIHGFPAEEGYVK